MGVLGHIGGSAFDRDWKGNARVSAPTPMNYELSRRLRAEKKAATALEAELRTANKTRRDASNQQKKEKRLRRAENRLRSVVGQKVSDKSVRKLTKKQMRAMNIVRVD